MSAAFYAKKAAQAERMLAKYGSSLTLKSLVPGTYNTATGDTGNAYVDVIFNGITLDYNDHLVDGEVIKRGDLLCLMSGMATVVPKQGDRVEFKSHLFDIINIEVLQPGAVAVLYEIQLRRR